MELKSGAVAQYAQPEHNCSPVQSSWDKERAMKITTRAALRRNPKTKEEFPGNFDFNPYTGGKLSSR